MNSKPTRKRRTAAAVAGSIQMTLEQAAAEFAIPRPTLRRRIMHAGLKVGDGVTYTVAEIHGVLMGSLEAERIRETRARADLLELERLEKQRDLVPMAEVDAKLVATFLPIRQRLMALPAEAAARCNPSDPQLAREALDRWVTDSLPLIRGAVANDEEVRRAA